MSAGGNPEAIILTEAEWFLITQENELQKCELRFEIDQYKDYIEVLKAQLRDANIVPHELVLEEYHYEEDNQLSTEQEVNANSNNSNTEREPDLEPEPPTCASPTAVSPRSQRVVEANSPDKADAEIREGEVTAEPDLSEEVEADSNNNDGGEKQNNPKVPRIDSGKINDKAVALMGDEDLEKKQR